MKVLIFALALIVSAASANDDLKRCSSKVKKEYLKTGPLSDIPITWRSEFLPAKTPYKNYEGKVVALFDQDTLLYFASGSYYSGWFTDLVIAEKETCRVLEMTNIYSE